MRHSQNRMHTEDLTEREIFEVEWRQMRRNEIERSFQEIDEFHAVEPGTTKSQALTAIAKTSLMQLEKEQLDDIYNGLSMARLWVHWASLSRKDDKDRLRELFNVWVRLSQNERNEKGQFKQDLSNKNASSRKAR